MVVWKTISHDLRYTPFGSHNGGCLKLAFSLIVFISSIVLAQQPNKKPDYLDFNLPFDKRVDDLVGRMTLEEKVSQMVNTAKAIPRLQIPQYNWWNECLHGVARAGTATVFPQAIGLAATWNTDLMYKVADVISTEARAKHHDFVRRGERDIYQGLTFWSPNINIFRDPRWGRGHETYGEDPYLTSRMGVAFVRGLQGNDPKYFKVIATTKHFAVHSGPEPSRHSFDAVTSNRDLYDTYLPAFEACIKEAGAYSVMCAYNRYIGEACCGSNQLLRKILRSDWGFTGYVVSDCGAVDDIFMRHKIVETAAQASAMAVRSGTDLECGSAYTPALLEAVTRGLLTEQEINIAVKRLFTARFKLGMFDPTDMVPYSKIPIEENDSEKHRKLSLGAARESIVLLKNSESSLPLNKNLRQIAVVGPTADSYAMLMGNYNGTPSHYVTPLQGIRNKVGKNTYVKYEMGCSLIGQDTSPKITHDRIQAAVNLAKESDVVVFVGGITGELEGEALKIEHDGFKGGDRTHLNLPRVQEDLLRLLSSTGRPIVLVLTSGSALSVNWEKAHIPAIVQLWYPGQEGGSALADVLFGDYNPGGRLPVTFYQSVSQLPAFEDYNMKGRTYRYFDKEPLFAFGYGLSYTKFEYKNFTVPVETKAGDSMEVSVEVQNTGKIAGDEVAQLYVRDLAASVQTALRSLQGFQRIHLKPDEKRILKFQLRPKQLAVIYDNGQSVIEPGLFEITVGGTQPGIECATTHCLTKETRVTGSNFIVH